GVAALTSAFPSLYAYTVELCLVVVGIITAVNMRGVAHSARVFIWPTTIFVGSVGIVIIVGLFRSSQAMPASGPAPTSVESVGILLLLKAFANGCVALTGVEAIANAVPSFRKPGVKRAQRTETTLGVVLATLLIGVAALIGRFGIHPEAGTTVLAQVTRAAIGSGPFFYVVQLSTTVLLALAANTSF